MGNSPWSPLHLAGLSVGSLLPLPLCFSYPRRYLTELQSPVSSLDYVLSEGRAPSDHCFTASSQLNREGNDQICQVSEIKGEWANEWRRGPLYSWLALNTLVLFFNSNKHYVSDLMETGALPHFKESNEKQNQSGKELLSN